MKAIWLLAALIASPALAADRYPTVPELEAGIGYVPGAQIPKDVPARNRAWHVFYVRAKAVGNGEYDVRIRLR